MNFVVREVKMMWRHGVAFHFGPISGKNRVSHSGMEEPVPLPTDCILEELFGGTLEELREVPPFFFLLNEATLKKNSGCNTKIPVKV